MSQEPSQYGTIGVLMGGRSSEREISLKSGNAICKGLVEAGCRAVAIDIASEKGSVVLEAIKKAGADIVFIALHGRFGEDGTLQAILDKAGVCYTGSGPKASEAAFNKVSSQTLFKDNDLQVPEFVVFRLSEGIERSVVEAIDLPVFVKPSREGSSIGISCVTEEQALKPAVELAWRYGEEALIEKAIAGRELTVGIVDGEALPVIEIRPCSAYFDFQAKYEKGKTEYIVPAPLDEVLTKQVQEAALKAYRALGCRHFARVDFMLDEKGRSYILEVNTIPGFTETSLLPKAAKAQGLSFNQLCLRIVSLAYGEKKEIKSISHSC